MSCGPERVTAPDRYSAFGLRLALWYATLFVVGAIAIVFLTYYLTATSLAQRDQQILQAKLGDYAAAYQRGGVRVLADDGPRRAATAPERLFVRVVDRGVEGGRAEQPGRLGSDRSSRRVAALSDGTLVQVGKSTEARERPAGAVSRRARARHAARLSSSRSPAAGSPRSRRCCRSAG